MTRLLIMGAPGAGKGTQAELVAKNLSIPTVSTGAMFRKEMKAQSELGKIAASYIEKGEYVPDEVTDRMVRNLLNEPQLQEGFLLDGYPRTLEQVQALDTFIADDGTQLDAVICLTINEDVVVDRILKRAEVEDRADDTEPVIRHRLEVYHQATQPILDVYEKRGILLYVDGMGTIEEVEARVSAAIKAHLG